MSLLSLDKKRFTEASFRNQTMEHPVQVLRPIWVFLFLQMSVTWVLQEDCPHYSLLTFLEDFCLPLVEPDRLNSWIFFWKEPKEIQGKIEDSGKSKKCAFDILAPNHRSPFSAWPFIFCFLSFQKLQNNILCQILQYLTFQTVRSPLDPPLNFTKGD